MALLWRLLVVAGVVGRLTVVARVAVVLVVFMAARVGTLVRGLVVRVLVVVRVSLAVVVIARSLVVPRLRRARSASAVNGVVTGWGRSRSNCLVLDNLAFGCRTVGHVEPLGAKRDGLFEEQAGAQERRQVQVE